MAVRVRSLSQYVTLAQYLKIAQPLTTRIPPPPQTNKKKSTNRLSNTSPKKHQKINFLNQAVNSTLLSFHNLRPTTDSEQYNHVH